MDEIAFSAKYKDWISIKKMGKGYSSLAEIFGGIKQGEVREILLSASSEQLLPIAEAYFMRKLITGVGYELETGTEMLSKIYPELKLPKPKGRFGKGKG